MLVSYTCKSFIKFTPDLPIVREKPISCQDLSVIIEIRVPELYPFYNPFLGRMGNPESLI